MSKSTIYLILNNIRSAYNVGSIFRTADGVGVSKIYLCGITPVPETNSNLKNQISKPKLKIQNLGKVDKVAKTALGAEKTVPWEYHKQALRLVKKLKFQNSPKESLRDPMGQTNLKIIALEQSPKSVNLFKYKPPKNSNIALIVGNEVKGLNKKILSCADKIIEIPMCGKKESLNVAVATGIALYTIILKIKKLNIKITY